MCTCEIFEVFVELLCHCSAADLQNIALIYMHVELQRLMTFSWGQSPSNNRPQPLLPIEFHSEVKKMRLNLIVCNSFHLAFDM